MHELTKKLPAVMVGNELAMKTFLNNLWISMTGKPCAQIDDPCVVNV